jgi:hypothetical protein
MCFVADTASFSKITKGTHWILFISKFWIVAWEFSMSDPSVQIFKAFVGAQLM